MNLVSQSRVKLLLPTSIGRFALAMLALFIVVGLALFTVLSTQIRDKQERFAEFHAVFVTHSLIEYEVHSGDMQGTISPVRAQELADFMRSRVLVYPAVDIKILQPDGTVLFATQEALIGHRLDSPAVANAVSGHTVSEVEGSTDRGRGSNPGLPPKLFATFLPLHVHDDSGGPVNAVVEFDQDYAGIQAAIDDLLRALIVTVAGGLAVLYLLLIPVARYISGVDFARRRAVRATDEKSRFLAFMSHELRTPLNGILGFSQLLAMQQSEPLSERQGRYVANIESSGRHLLDITNDILDLSKVEAGVMELAMEDVAVWDVVEQAVQQVSPLANRASLSVVNGVSRELWVVADAIRLKQVLLNLASNAIKFTPEGGKIQIAAAELGGWVELSVEDSGEGIPPEALERLFQPYVQVDGDPNRKAVGSGLGLALSRGLIERMGGQMAATSIVGEGTRFTFTLSAATRLPRRLDVPVRA